MTFMKDVILAVLILLILGLIAWLFQMPSNTGTYSWWHTSTVQPYTNGSASFTVPEPITTTNTTTITYPSTVAKTCYVGGCSGEICSDSSTAVSNCTYTASYACYKNARCEPQANGACGWTMDSSLMQCLAGSYQ